MQRSALEIRDKQVTDSIRSAMRIQTALQPPIDKLQTQFSDVFILHLPKDIVSGDFYWFHEKENKGLVYVIVGDCTGHGVPGAFMTMLANTTLNKIIIDLDIDKPDEVLYKLDTEITQLLSQGKYKQSEGMDLTILVLNKNEKQILFAGAKNPLLWVRNGKLERVKGSIYGIGGRKFDDKPKVFTSFSTPYQPEDIFYLTSDGFQDQFGRRKNHEKVKKYMVKNFRELLSKISALPMEEQKYLLENEFTTWKGKEKQTDDILVMGLKI